MTEPPLPEHVQWQLAAAEHYVRRLATMAGDELDKRYETATTAFDQEWPQIRTAHEWAAANRFDDGRLAYAFFLLGTELRRRRLSAAQLDFGAGPALRYAKTQGVVAHVDLLLALSQNAQYAVRLVRAEAYARAALRLLRRCTYREVNTEARKAQVMALCALSGVLNDQGRIDEAIDACHEALSKAERIPFRAGQNVARGNLALALTRAGRHEEALENLARAIRLALLLGDRISEQRWTAGAAEALRKLGRLEEALAAAESSAELAEKVGDRRASGRAHITAGAIALSVGHQERAAEHQRKAYETALDTGDLIGKADALTLRSALDGTAGTGSSTDEFADAAATILDSTGRPHDADILRREAAARARTARTRELLYLFTNAVNSAERAAGRGDVTRALTTLDNLITTLRAPDDSLVLAAALAARAFALERADRPAEAATGYAEALDAHPGHPMKGSYLLGQARNATAAGDLLTALIAYHEAVDCFRGDEGQREELGTALAALGEIAIGMRSFSAARAVYEEAAGHFTAIDSPQKEVAFAGLTALKVREAQADSVTPKPPGTLSVAEVRARLEEIGPAMQRTPGTRVRVRMTDGRGFEGEPLTVLSAEVSLLTVEAGSHEVAVPLEWLTELTIVQPDSPST
ncbi:tetratricopeptide repeat protein [Streptomyces sp. NPDC004311]|uniref:tetratricopeptide repeat protein n=1 Tax=Streptomyces sp. NPDC004311 TaxID=3364698 RepID=UPI0036CA7666